MVSGETDRLQPAAGCHAVRKLCESPDSVLRIAENTSRFVHRAHLLGRASPLCTTPPSPDGIERERSAAFVDRTLLERGLETFREEDEIQQNSKEGSASHSTHNDEFIAVTTSTTAGEMMHLSMEICNEK